MNISALDHHNIQSSVTLRRHSLGRYGALHLDGDVVNKFQEKPDGDNA